MAAPASATPASATPASATPASAATTASAAAPDYSVPALDKAFDVLDVLAERSDGVSQSELAEATGRSVGQIFRVLAALEARGWILRDRASGLYFFSMAAFDLAHRHPPLRGLLVAATPPMRELAAAVRQSCNLAVLDMGAVRVIAQVESPADFGYRVRVGALFPLDSATGSVLTGDAGGAVLRRDDPREPGITDLVAPIDDRHGGVRAALTVPYVGTSYSEIDVAEVVAQLAAAARVIERRITGSSQHSGR